MDTKTICSILKGIAERHNNSLSQEDKAALNEAINIIEKKTGKFEYLKIFDLLLRVLTTIKSLSDP